MAKYFVDKDEKFRIVLPISVVHEEAPQILFVEGIEQLPAVLRGVPADKLEYHYCEFRRAGWGLDCFLRELAYDGTRVGERTFSREKFDEVRLRYLLTGASFFPTKDPISFSTTNNYETLSSSSEEFVKKLSPFILRIFLSIASSVWDVGLPIRHLLSEADYLMLRDDPDGLKKVCELKGLVNKKIVNEDDPVKKEPVGSVPERPSTQNSNPETPVG